MGNHANLGYLFQRGYYRDLTLDVWNDSSENKVNQSRYFKTKNDSLIRSSKREVESDFLLNLSEKDGLRKIELQTVYPGLVTGIGMVHQTGMQGECKLGMAFDYTSGLPSIPGSSVKGLIRSVFPILPPNKKTKDELTEEEKNLIDSKRIFIQNEWKELKHKELPELDDAEVDELAEQIFCGKIIKDGKEEYLSIYKRDVFFDAEICGNYVNDGILGLDYITAHKDELADPNPVQFLKILPGVKFVFRFRLEDAVLSSGKTIKSDAKKELFKRILKTVGIGAKTNVGYGQLGEVSQSSKTATVEVSQKVGIQIANEELVNTNVDSSIEANDETPIEITPNRPANPQIEEKICTGKLEKLPGLGLKVRIEDPKYSEAFYDLRFKQNNDIKQIKRGTTRVRVALKVKNNKVIEVWFKGVIA